MSAVAERSPDAIELVPMRRRHLRSVMRIESQVYPRPWSTTLFLQEIARRYDRYYIVARAGSDVVGYGGLMMVGTEAHITTIAVDPAMQRRHIGLRIMHQLITEAINRGAGSVSLEVRKTNFGAQRMYERFGFRPIGIRKGYYIETGEDAIVMWVDGIADDGYRDRLSSLLAGEGPQDV